MLLVSVSILMRLVLALRPEPLIYTKYYQEDSFYLFNCAEHLAHGDGLSADGVHPTNGVQPLIVGLYAVLFLASGFNKLLALRMAFGYIALFDAAAMLLVYWLVRRMRRPGDTAEESPSVLRDPAILAAGFYALLFTVFFHTMSGLETGLYSALMLASVAWYARLTELPKPSTWRSVILGVLLGLTVLARIDGAILVVAIIGYDLYRTRARSIRRDVIVGSVAVIVSLPWWYYNVATFGHLMPQSGLSERMDVDISRNFWTLLSTIADSAAVFFSVTKMVIVHPGVYALWFTAVAITAYFVAIKMGLWRSIREAYDLRVLLPLLFVSVVFAIYYTFFFGAPYFIPRYMQPFRIVMLMIGAMAIPQLLDRAGRVPLLRIGLGVIALAAALNTGLRYLPMFASRQVSSFYQMGHWALNHSQERVGMLQTGTTEFIAPNVVNLDGKTNFEALSARMNGGIGNYIVKEKLEYLADQREWIPMVVRSAEQAGAKYRFVDSVEEIMIYRRE